MNTQIEEIKNRLDVVDVVGRYVQLKQAGKNFSGICPFHGEKTPSFIVSPELQRYKCFGCGETGDIFNFVQKIENIDFSETLEKLAKEAGVTLEKKKSNDKYERLEEINKRAANFFYQQLYKPENKDALEYVRQRGFTEDSIKAFGIGYASGNIGLIEYIQKDKKYTKDELLNSGIFTLKDGKLRSKFYKRIMFPIRSSSGKVIAFTGRVLPGNEYGPKYMNSPETPIYHKKNNFYGQYESRQEIRKQDLVIICEGTTDVISAHQAGVKNIIAPLGTALTMEQLQKISQYTKNILFLFDSDTAGQRALERAFEMAQELELNTFATNTLPYKDLDELIKSDSFLLRKLIRKKLDTFTYLLISYIKDKNLNKYEDFHATETWVKKALNKVKDKNTQAFYVEKVYKLTKISLGAYNTSLKDTNSKLAVQKQPSINTNREMRYLQLIIFSEPLKIPDEHNTEYFTDTDIREILESIKNSKDISRDKLIQHHQDNPSISKLLENAIFQFSQTDTDQQELEQIYSNIAKDYFINKEKELNVKIGIAEESGNQKESERLLLEFQELTQQRHKYEQDRKL